MSIYGAREATTGFSGADLTNIMNECAISAARDDVGMITPEIIGTVYQR